MTSLAQKLDARFKKLDPETLRVLEGAFLSVLTAVEQRGGESRQPLPQAKPYKLRTYALGIQPGLDPDKLEQLPEDY